MVNFAGYHYIAATEIAVVSSKTDKETVYPYGISVILKSGKELIVNWKQQNDRDEEYRNLLLQIDRELRQDYEKIYNQLYLLRDSVSRVDKRQLRIWKQLRDLFCKQDVDLPSTP